MEQAGLLRSEEDGVLSRVCLVPSVCSASRLTAWELAASAELGRGWAVRVEPSSTPRPPARTRQPPERGVRALPGCEGTLRHPAATLAAEAGAARSVSDGHVRC